MAHGIDADVLAGGTVCWQVRDGELFVLVVHRPKYDDWSWPKGKAERGESLPETAVREVEEETGLRVRLGVPLPPLEYELPEGLSKYVAFWASYVPEHKLPPPPRPAEVDQTKWIAASDAAKILTREDDCAQLDAICDLFERDALDTWPLVILRHGYAFPRRSWSEHDDARPLVDAGTAQAEHLRSLLAAWDPHRVVTSPARRCAETVRKYASDYGKPLKTKKRLLERRHREHPEKVTKLLDKLRSRGESVVCCTHRPVLPTVMEWVRNNSSSRCRELVPTSNPYLEPGELLVAHVSSSTNKIVGIYRHQADALH